MYHGPPPDLNRSVTWRSIIAGFAIMVGFVVLLVAVSYPWKSLAILAVGAGGYALYRIGRLALHTDRIPILGTTLTLRRVHRPR